MHIFFEFMKSTLLFVHQIVFSMLSVFCILTGGTWNFYRTFYVNCSFTEKFSFWQLKLLCSWKIKILSLKKLRLKLNFNRLLATTTENILSQNIVVLSFLVFFIYTIYRRTDRQLMDLKVILNTLNTFSFAFLLYLCLLLHTSLRAKSLRPSSASVRI